MVTLNWNWVVNITGICNNAQVFITTHSRDVIVELNAEDLFKVSKNSDKLYSFAASEQGTLRSNPEAFFAKKIIFIRDWISNTKYKYILKAIQN